VVLEAIGDARRAPAAAAPNVDDRARSRSSPGHATSGGRLSARPLQHKGRPMSLATELTVQSPVKVMVVLCPSCAAQAADQATLLDGPARLAQPVQSMSYASTLTDEHATWEDAEWQ
jgi:hypothetical protein